MQFQGQRLPQWRRAVIKVGSGLISPDGKGCKTQRLLPIARFMTENMHRGREVILVSSGAVAAGRSLVPDTGLGTRRSIPEKQALAALGQCRLMGLWGSLMDVPCAQMLLTHDDLVNRRRFVNVKGVLFELLKYGMLPIINENDSVAVDELKVGDNDNLAAHVAVMAEADLLLILSDIDGLFDANPNSNPNAALIPKVSLIDESVFALAGDTHNPIATGGMFTKIQAAEKATKRGINTVIANGSKGTVLEALLHDRNPGTLFEKTAGPIAAKKHWLTHALPVSGQVTVDHGAAQALLSKGASLLPVGVVAVNGKFQRGDAVEIVLAETAGPRVIARGLTQYGADALNRIRGVNSEQIADVLGYRYGTVAVHRGDMVVI